MTPKDKRPTGRQNVCVFEPYTFGAGVLFCSELLDHPLTLPTLHDLADLAASCVLHDTVIVPDAGEPRFRYRPSAGSPRGLDDPDSFDDAITSVLTESPLSGFTTREPAVRNVPTPTYVNALREAVSEGVEAELRENPPIRFGSGVRDGDRRELDDWETSNLVSARMGRLAYYARLGAIAEETHGSLTLQRESRDFFFTTHTVASRSVTEAMLESYAQKTGEAAAKVSIEPYKKVTFRSPFFLDLAVAQSANLNRKAVLHNLVDMHWQLATKFRQLASVVGAATQAETVALQLEFDRVIDGLVGGSRIPRPGIRLLVDVITFVPSILSGPEALLGRAKDIWELVSAEHRPLLYSGLRMFNDIHRRGWLNAEEFYQELRRVFGEVSFSAEEMKASLTGAS